MKRVFALILVVSLLPMPVLAQQDDCPPGHIRNPQVSALDHAYMLSAFKASFRGLFGRDPSMQPGSGLDDGEYYVAQANHFGVYGDDQCHAGWSGYWESWLEVGHGDLGRVQTPARFLPNAAPVVVPPPVVVTPPAPLPSTDLVPVLTAQAINHASEMAELAELKTQIALVRQDIADFRSAVRSRWVAVVDSPIVKYGLAAVAGWFVKNAVKP